MKVIHCPNCDHVIDFEYSTCERRCSTTDYYWCEVCGAIGMDYDGDREDIEWDIPVGI